MVAYFAAACAVIAAASVTTAAATTEAKEKTSEHTDSQGQAGAAGDYQKYMSGYADKYTGGQGLAGDYSKYMSQYSKGGDYNKYMSQYSKGGDYQKYMSQYSKGGDYQKYMQGQGKNGMQGDYKQYMSLYASNYTKTGATGDYQKYMSQYSKGGDYQKYADMQDQMKSTAPMSPDQCKNETELRAWRAHQLEQIETFVPKSFQSQGREVVEHQYQQRLSQLQGKNVTMAPAQAQTQLLPQFLMSVDACKNETELRAWRDHQVEVIKKNVPKEYQHFPLAAVKKQFEQMLAKFHAQGSNHTATGSNHTAKKGEEPKVASVEMLVQQSGADGAAMEQPKTQAVYHKYMSRFAGPYTHYMASVKGSDDSSNYYDLEACTKLQQRATVGDTAIVVPMVLATARMCEKEKELRALRACQEAEVDRNTPAAYKRFAIQKIEDQFQERLAQLKNKSSSSALSASSVEEVPVLLVTAQKCENEGELRAWRVHQLKEVDDNVPKAYQGLARHTIERTFAQHLARMQERAQKAAPGEATASGVAEQTKSKADEKADQKVDQKADEKAEVAPITLDSSAAEVVSSTEPGHMGWAKALGFVLVGLMIPAFISAFSRRQHASSSDVYLLNEDDEVV